jgi:transcription-repair coupling factor (superfamily II helicase)
MFYRKILKDLEKWRVSDSRKPMIIRGALQVGKTTVVNEFSKQLIDRYGPYDERIERLIEIANLRILARKAKLSEIILSNKKVKFAPVMLPDSRSVRLTRLYPGSVLRPTARSIVLPSPDGAAIIPWAQEVITSVILGEEPEEETR